MKKKFVASVSLALVASMVLSGCSSVIGDDVASYPLVNALSEQEIMDYYAESLQYDAIVSRNVEVHEEEYVLREVDDAKAEKLRTLVSQAEQVLGRNEYTEGAESIISEDVFNYIKATIDGLTLSDGNVDAIQQALGYYFVDVTYQASARTAGTFNQLTPLIGINGVFVKSATGEDTIDLAYLTTAQEKLNEYFAENKISQVASFDAATGAFTIEEGEAPQMADVIANNEGRLVLGGGEDENLDVDGDGINDTTPEGEETLDGEDATGDEEGAEAPDPAAMVQIPADVEWTVPGPAATSQMPLEDAASGDAEATDGEATPEDGEATADGEEAAEEESEEVIVEDGESIEIQRHEDAEAPLADGTTTGNGTTTGADDSNIGISSSGIAYQSLVSSDRKSSLDVDLFNAVVGSSTEVSAYMPDLSLVYNIPAAEGTISGYGIYPEGANGLRLFGFDRNNLSGTVTIRYIFKEAVNGTGEIIGTNAYVYDENLSSGFSTVESNVLIPTFLQSQLEQIVERADRINADYILPAYMSGDIYEDMGFGVLRGFKEKSTNVLKNMSVVRSVLSRDSENNAYLIEVESTVMDGAKSADVYGTYRDISYVVVQQQGDEFVIIDQMRVSRQVYKEPAINPDSATEKRLVALNLAGEVSEAAQSEITQLINDLYTASTARLLNGPAEVSVAGEKVTLEKGMYDCFNDDPEMLSSSEREYMNSELRGQLISEGVNVDSTMTGAVTQWMGGYDNQAEFTTEELITYEGKNKGLYMEVYYLVSKMHDEWVIDERRVINSEEYTGNDLSTMQSSLGQ